VLILLTSFAAVSCVAARAQTARPPRTPQAAYERATEPLREWAKSKNPTLESNLKANEEQERRARSYAPLFRAGDWRGEQLFALGQLNFVALRPAAAEQAFVAYLRRPSASKVTAARKGLLWALVEQKSWGRAAPVADILFAAPDYDADANSYVQLLIRRLRATDGGRAVALSERRLPGLLRLIERQENPGLAAALLKDALELGELYREAGKVAESEKFIDSFLSQFRQSRLSSNERVKQSVESSIRRVRLLGAPAPQVEGADYVDTQRVDLAALKGRVVVLDFFAHWCAPCLNEFATFNSLKEKFERAGLVVVGVTQYYGFFGEREKLSSGEELAALKGLKAARGAKLGFVIGPRSNFDAYGVGGLPVTVFIDRVGRVRAVRTGGASGEEIETLIRTLLAEPAHAAEAVDSHRVR
jgi:thiol-disulfide isomerase/thioredoxin